MSASIIQSKTATTNGLTPFSVTLDATPTQGNAICVIVNSDTTVTGPTGYTSRGLNTGNQAAYVWDKVAGASESATITVTPSTLAPTVIMAIEISNTSGFDAISTVASTQGSSSQVSRTINSLTTASGNGDLVIATVLTHSFTAPQAGISWDNDFTALTTVGPTTAGNAGLQCEAHFATRTVAASTAVGTTTCSWTNILSDTTGWHVAYSSTATTLNPMPWFGFIDSTDPSLFQNLTARFDFTGNTTDTSGQNNNATIHGTVTATTDRKGITNGAYNFDGSTGYMSTANSQSNPQIYSINVWFKTTTTSGGMLVGFGDVQVTAPNNWDRMLWMSQTGEIIFGVYTGSHQVVIGSNVTYNDGNWHMATATMSGTDGMTLYMDGVSVDTNVNTISQPYTGWWRIGEDTLASWDNGSNFFAGSLDDVKIYSIALNSTQVSKLYAL